MEHQTEDDFPLCRFLGMKIEDDGPGCAHTSLKVTGDLLNPHGVGHGGVVFTMIDTAMGKATMSMLGEGQLCASIEIHARFIRPVGEGSLVARVDVVRPGRRVFHLEARVVDGADRLVATATGTFAVLEQHQPSPAV